MTPSDEVKKFSPLATIVSSIITTFIAVIGTISTLIGIFSLAHVLFGRGGDSIRIGRRGRTLDLMDDVPSSLIVLAVGIILLGILWIRRQARRQNWYRSHRLMFRVGLIIVMIPISRGAYRGIVSMNGGDAIYAAQKCDTQTIRELHDKGEIADTDKNEMLMRMAQRGCAETLLYVLDQGWDANTVYNNTPIVNTAGSFATATTIIALVDHGADVNSIDQGMSLLMRVLQNSTILPEEKKYVVKTLIEKGANVDYISPSGLSVDQLADSARIDLSSL